MPVHQVKSLDIDEDLTFQAVEWRANSLTWILLLALITACLAGLFGRGVLSTTLAGPQGSALWIEYDRFLRHEASTRIVIHAQPSADGAVHLTIGRALLDGLRIERITPMPVSARLSQDGVEYRFPAGAGDRVAIVVDARPIERGRLRGEVRSASIARQLSQFVYP